MSSDETVNPDQPGSIPPKPRQGGIRYGRSLQYVFDSPNWMLNLLIGALCLFSTSVIPFVGQLLWMGYQFEIVEVLHRGAATYPDFTFNRFTEYLLRGLWVMLAMLLLLIVFIPVFLVLASVLFICTGALVAATGGDEEVAGVAFVVAVVLFIPLALAMNVLLSVIAAPFVLRAGLSQEFNEIFNFAFAKDFIRKMWKETTLVTLFWFMAMIGGQLLGLLACCIGIYPALAWVFLVQGFLYVELYELYLARGGEPIPLKEPKPPAVA